MEPKLKSYLPLIKSLSVLNVLGRYVFGGRGHARAGEGHNDAEIAVILNSPVVALGIRWMMPWHRFTNNSEVHLIRALSNSINKDTYIYIYYRPLSPPRPPLKSYF